MSGYARAYETAKGHGLSQRLCVPTAASNPGNVTASRELQGAIPRCRTNTPFSLVLKEPNRRAESQSTMWVMRGGPPHQPILRFEYDVSRGFNPLIGGSNSYWATTPRVSRRNHCPVIVNYPILNTRRV